MRSPNEDYVCQTFKGKVSLSAIKNDHEPLIHIRIQILLCNFTFLRKERIGFTFHIPYTWARSYQSYLLFAVVLLASISSGDWL